MLRESDVTRCRTDEMGCESPISLPFSLSFSLGRRARIMRHTHRCYMGWQIIIAHILLSGCRHCVGDTMPGPVSATHPFLIVSTENPSPQFTPISPPSKFRRPACFAKCCAAVAANKSTSLLRILSWLFTALSKRFVFLLRLINQGSRISFDFLLNK